MITKTVNRKMRLILVGILGLSLILAYPSSLNAGLCLEKNAAQSLRKTAFANGVENPGEIFNAQPAATAEFGEVIEGADLEIAFTQGYGDVEYPDMPGALHLIAAGEIIISSESRKARTSSAGEEKQIDAGYGSEALDKTRGRYLKYHAEAVQTDKELTEPMPVGEDNFIALNVDLLPDNFETATADSREIAYIKGLFTAIAERLRQYNKIDRRYANRIFLEFVSNTNDITKMEAAAKIFKGLKFLEEYGIDYNDFVRSAPENISLSNKIVITYAEDISEIKYTPLRLATKSVVGGQIVSYPWPAYVDLCVRILTLDRKQNIKEQKAYNSIKTMFESLLGTNKDIDENLLNMFLSNNPNDIREAVKTKLFDLPEIEKVDWDKLEQLIDIMIEVAKYA